MCLSAPVSFTAAAVLIAAGSFFIWHTWRHDRRFTGLASLPMLLGLQQFTEGIIWVAGAHNDVATTAVFSLYYVFFA